MAERWIRESTTSFSIIPDDDKMFETKRSSSSKHPLPSSPPHSSKRSKAKTAAEASSSTNDAAVVMAVETLSSIKESGSTSRDPRLQSSDSEVIVDSKLASANLS